MFAPSAAAKSSTNLSPRKPEHRRRPVVPRDVIAVSQRPVRAFDAGRDGFVLLPAAFIEPIGHLSDPDR